MSVTKPEYTEERLNLVLDKHAEIFRDKLKKDILKISCLNTYRDCPCINPSNMGMNTDTKTIASCLRQLLQYECVDIHNDGNIILYGLTPSTLKQELEKIEEQEAELELRKKFFRKCRKQLRCRKRTWDQTLE